MRIGIVTFAGTATIVQPPTRNKDDLVAAIDRFQLQLHTAIGSGIIVSLATLFPDEGIDLEQASFGSAMRRERGKALPSGRAAGRAEEAVHAGGARARTLGRDHPAHRRPAHDRPRSARRRASMAADHGVRVYTVGFGTAERRDGRHRGHVDLHALRRGDAEVDRRAHQGASTSTPATATDLQKIYETLNAKLVLEKKDTEISMLFAALAALLTLAAATLSMLWFHRFP